MMQKFCQQKEEENVEWSYQKILHKIVSTDQTTSTGRHCSSLAQEKTN